MGIIPFITMETVEAGDNCVSVWMHMPMDMCLFQIMLHMPYSRLLEREADKVGLQLAARVCGN